MGFFSAVPAAPGVPRVQDLKGTTAIVVWEDRESDSDPKNRFYSLEARRLRTSEWIAVREKVSELQCSVERLHPGECYSFRVSVQVAFLFILSIPHYYLVIKSVKRFTLSSSRNFVN